MTCMTTLGYQLYLAQEGSNQIVIYNTEDFTETDRLTIHGMLNPHSLAACSYHNCLYISDADSNYIHRVSLSNKPVSKWLVDGKPVALSVTKSRNLLITLYGTDSDGIARLLNYTTYGDLRYEIRLADSIRYPWHSIELSTGQFVVCHVEPSTHGVCVVDRTGRIMRSYGEGKGSEVGQLNGPRHLAVDTNDNVFVSDEHNDKIQLLNPYLEYLGDLTLPLNHLQSPRQIYFDRRNSSLYISESNRQIFIN